MSLITTINGIPLFSTLAEALAWARSNKLTGYHTHTYQNKTGYMGGATHNQATAINKPVARATQTQTTTQTSISTPSSNSGGGY